jgi:hypothetical protein
MGPLDGLDDVKWRSLSIAGSNASHVPEMLRLFASPVPGEVEAGWELLIEEGLSHQGTVYPGTAAAIRFIAALAASEMVLRRARLIELLAFLSLGHDQPYAPAGTARHVRDAVRLCAIDVHPVLATDDVAVQLALAELAAAMPVEMSPAHDLVQRLCASATDSRVTALAAAACLLGADTPHDWTYCAEPSRHPPTLQSPASSSVEPGYERSTPRPVSRTSAPTAASSTTPCTTR